jgi:hypothetical protein
MVAKTTPYYYLFFNLPQSFFCLQRRHGEHRDFFFMVSLFYWLFFSL